jgi:hypothetical protein
MDHAVHSDSSWAVEGSWESLGSWAASEFSVSLAGPAAVVVMTVAVKTNDCSESRWTVAKAEEDG